MHGGGSSSYQGPGPCLGRYPYLSLKASCGAAIFGGDMRAVWKGYLKLSLVTIPVKTDPAANKKPLKSHLYPHQGDSRRGAGSYQEQTPGGHFRAAFLRFG